MSEDTEILSPEGWIGYEDVEVGQVIKTFNIHTGQIEDLPVQRAFSRHYEGLMYNLKGETQDQLISPGHRVVRIAGDKFVLEQIEKILEYQFPIIIPIAGKNRNPAQNISDDELFAAITEIKKVDYSGIIWCPNTANETVIARRNGKVFITGNTPFFNVTMDLEVPSAFKDHPVIIGGKYQSETYSEFQPEMDILNEAFAEIMMEGDATGRVFTFPIPTYNITKDFDWNNPNLNKVWLMTGKFGIPYFCLEADTPVMKDDFSAISVSCLRPGDKVLDEKGEPVQVTAVCSQQVDETVHIELETGEKIVATPSHRFPTESGIKTAEELSLINKLQRVSLSSIKLEFSRLEIGIRECQAWFEIFQLNPELEFVPADISRLQIGQALWYRDEADT